MPNKKKLYLALFFLFSVTVTTAQTGKSKLSLESVLGIISKQDGIKFSYIVSEIENISIFPPEKKWSVTEKIDYLSRITSLSFKKVGENYYSIYNNPQTKTLRCAYLIDAVTQNPIENAYVVSAEGSTNTFSDSKGYFELPVSSTFAKVEHPGYEELKITWADFTDNNCPTLALMVKTTSLEEVLTHRYLTTGITKKRDGSIEIKPQKFGLLPGLIEPDVLQTMQQIPGIISVEETVSNINVRGGTHDQNLFLWNGIKMYQTGHFFGMISAFNPSLSQTISIYKNGSSAFFGESVSALVTIDSQEAQTLKNETSLSTNLISADFFTRQKIFKNSTLSLSARRSITNFFESPTYNNYRNRIFQNTVITDLTTNQAVERETKEVFYFFDVTAQLELEINPKNKLDINFIGIKNDLDFEQSQNETNKLSRLDQSSIGGSITWNSQWNKYHKTTFSGYATNYLLTSGSTSFESDQVLNQKNEILEFQFQLKHEYQIRPGLNLNLGYQLQETGVTNFDKTNIPLFSRTITNVLLSHIGIFESIWKSHNAKTEVMFGVRANYFSKFKEFLAEPRLRFSQSLSDHLVLELLGEQKSQTLSQIVDLRDDFLGIENRRWTLANNNSVPIQRSNQISLGFKYQKNKWLITLEQFYKQVTGITTSSQSFQNQFETQKSVGEYGVLGTEFLIQKTFQKFYTWLSYSFNENDYEFTRLYSVMFPNNYEIEHIVSCAGIYEIETIKLALGAKWHTGRPITTPLSNTVTPTNPEISYNNPNNERLKDYFQINASVSKEWNLGNSTKLATSLSVLNLLNTRNSINRFYRINSLDNSVESVDTFSLERTPNLNIKLVF